MQKLGDNNQKWDENFDFDLWMSRYAPKLHCVSSEADEAEHGFREASWEWKRTIAGVPVKGGVQSKQALCCPEDVRRHPTRCSHAVHTLCKHCSVPMCIECWSRLQSHIPAGYKIPAALANDNFQGYVHPFIVLNKVKWIEAVTACPFFSSQVTYYVEGKAKARHTLAGEELGRAERAYGTRGNIYSYILPWESILRNAACVTTEELFKSWPHPPDVVGHMIRFIFQGADEQYCMAWLKELHVRSHVLVCLGRIYAEHLHELVSETPTAKDLLSRAEYIAQYESNVCEHYPAERFGAEKEDFRRKLRRRHWRR